MLFLMLYVPTARYFTMGPLWPQSTGFEVDECKDTWWKNILYINNIVEPEKMVCPFKFIVVGVLLVTSHS